MTSSMGAGEEMLLAKEKNVQSEAPVGKILEKVASVKTCNSDKEESIALDAGKK